MEPLFTSLIARIHNEFGPRNKPPPPIAHHATLAATYINAAKLIFYRNLHKSGRSGGLSCTWSPYGLTFSDENVMIAIWQLISRTSSQPLGCAVSHHLTVGGVQLLGFGNASPLRERIFSFHEVGCECAEELANPDTEMSCGSDLESDAQPPLTFENPNLIADWVDSLPSLGESLREPGFALPAKLSTKPSNYQVRDKRRSRRTGFEHFEDLPLELRRYIIRDFVEDVIQIFGPSHPETMWRFLATITEGQLYRNRVLEMLAAKFRYLRGCMILGTAWYQVIAHFLLKYPVVTNTDGTRFLRQVRDNLKVNQFSHLLLSRKSSRSPECSELGYDHIPEFYEYRDGPVDCTVQSQFSIPSPDNVEQLLVTPEDWSICADNDYPGGSTAFRGWGNAWMIQDALRSYPGIKRLVLALGSTGDNSWAFPNSGADLSNLTHLHLDVPLPRHFHPGGSSFERFKSYSCGSGILQSFPTRPTLVPSHHLCTIFAPLAPKLEILSIHGAGAHVCHELFDAPWVRLRELNIALDGENGGICNGALQSTRDAARRLKARLPHLDMRLSVFLLDDDTYHAQPYSWGGNKLRTTQTFPIPQDVSNNPKFETQICCLICCWGIACRITKSGHKSVEGLRQSQNLAQVYHHRVKLSASGWLLELGHIRAFQQYDPLRDVQDHCGDVDGDWLRVHSDTLPKPDLWLDTSLAPSGDRCGIKRDKNLEGCIMPSGKNNFSFGNLAEHCERPTEMSMRSTAVREAVGMAFVRAWLESVELISID